MVEGGDVSSWEEAGLHYRLEDGVAWLQLNRPHKRNAIDRPLRNALLAAVHEVTESIDARAAVITGSGVAFSSGADLTQEGGAVEIPPARRHTGPNGPRSDALLYGWSRLMNAIWVSEKPFLAAVNGVAAGAGCQLALACDLIVASDQASFWEIFVRRGLPLEGGGAWILPRLLSLVRAKELAIFGEPLCAADAEKWGLINRCVPAADFEETVRSWARRLAGGPTVRIGHIKAQLNSSLESTMAGTFREEATLLGVGGGDDAAEAMRAFAERREPQFHGR